MPAKKKPTPRTKTAPRRKAARKASPPGPAPFFLSRPFRQFAVFVIVVVLLAVFWDSLQGAYAAALSLFGWGLIFIIAAIIVFIALLWSRRGGSFIRRWSRWLGGIAFVLVVWGILGFFPGGQNLPDSLGGKFGRAIINFPNEEIVGPLRLAGLTLIGLLLVAPRASFRALGRFGHWVADTFRRPPARQRPPRREPAPSSQPRLIRQRPPYGEKPPLPAEMDTPVIAPEVSTSMKRLEAMAEKVAAARRPAAEKPAEKPVREPAPREETGRELRQVAEDVWRKYGEAPDLVVQDGWRLPPLDILDVSPEVQFSQADNVQRAKLIEETLGSYGVEAKVVQINAGPTVTQFGVEPGWVRKYKEVKERDRDGNVQVRMEEVAKTRVKVERISSLANDLALALAAPTIRIEAPVPGKTFVGIEVPNMTSDMVSLRGVVESPAFQKLSAKTKMTLALGKGAGGEAVAADLTKMPHLLIAGATGSGKTVCLNTIVCCLLMSNTPNDIRFILVDPKRVELTQYNSLPHMATPVIVDSRKAIGVLQWLLQEMEERYKKLAAAGARHIEGYNKNKTGSDKLPYLILVVDELADLMMASFDEVESSLCRLAQLARATGIHLVVATQRPSVDVVTGLIKANFPTRISFAVTSQVDSRTILDGAGAEKLLGQGDMLYMPTEASKPKRLQGCFLSDPEIDRLVYFWSSQQPEAAPDKLKMDTLIATTPAGTIGGHPRDPLLEQARELARQYENVSTSFLQRKLHIGYPRAARLMEQLEAVLQKELEEEAGEGGGGE